MQKAVIYYQLEPSLEMQRAIEHINSLIEKIEDEIIGVFVELPNTDESLLNMINHDLSVISCLYINKMPNDEFNQQLLKELSRQEGFAVKYLHEL